MHWFVQWFCANCLYWELFGLFTRVCCVHPCKSKYLIIDNKILFTDHFPHATLHFESNSVLLFDFNVRALTPNSCQNDLKHKNHAEKAALLVFFFSHGKRCIDFRSYVLACNQKSARKQKLLWKQATLWGWWTLKWDKMKRWSYVVSMFYIYLPKFCRLHVINFPEIPTSRIINFWFEFYSM